MSRYNFPMLIHFVLTVRKIERKFPPTKLGKMKKNTGKCKCHLFVAPLRLNLSLLFQCETSNEEQLRKNIVGNADFCPSALVTVYCTQCAVKYIPCFGFFQFWSSDTHKFWTTCLILMISVSKRLVMTSANWFSTSSTDSNDVIRNCRCFFNKRIWMPSFESYSRGWFLLE